MMCPRSGILGEVSWPACTQPDASCNGSSKSSSWVRIDTWIRAGTEVTIYYDSLLAKVMVHHSSREQAIDSMRKVLGTMRVKGIPTNAQLLSEVLGDADFVSGAYTTHVLEGITLMPSYFEVIEAGMQTSVQDWPGRTKLWKVGVPPSGPMDADSLRFANALVGNECDAAGLEITMRGPTLKFHRDAIAAVCGAPVPITVSGESAPMWTSFSVAAGEELSIGQVAGEEGLRCYLAIAGGVDAPVYLGSRSTFPSGNLGGFQGRALRAGDSCELGQPSPSVCPAGLSVPEDWRMTFGSAAEEAEHRIWRIRMIPGPQGAPDYFTEDDISVLTSSPYTVHYNSNRLGIRLTGARPQFARTDGGEGGAHPSNVHDHVYALGTINFSGDMPIILTVDGPSLGGFVCPATTIFADMWKWGQVRSGDEVYFEMVTLEFAHAQRCDMDRKVAELMRKARGEDDAAEQALHDCPQGDVSGYPETKAVLRQSATSQWRLAGDRYVFVEFGEMVLDLNTRIKVGKLEECLSAAAVEGLIETSPGVRSLMIEYDSRLLPLPKLLNILEKYANCTSPHHVFRATA